MSSNKMKYTKTHRKNSRDNDLACNFIPGTDSIGEASRKSAKQRKQLEYVSMLDSLHGLSVMKSEEQNTTHYFYIIILVDKIWVK